MSKNKKISIAVICFLLFVIFMGMQYKYMLEGISDDQISRINMYYSTITPGTSGGMSQVGISTTDKEEIKKITELLSSYKYRKAFPELNGIPSTTGITNEVMIYILYNNDNYYEVRISTEADLTVISQRDQYEEGALGFIGKRKKLHFYNTLKDIYDKNAASKAWTDIQEISDNYSK